MKKQETLVSILDNAVEKYSGSRIAVKSQITGESWTYDWLKDKALRVRGALSNYGVDKGDRIAIFSDNTPRFVAADLGALYSGAVSVPINEKLKPENLMQDYLKLVKPLVILSEGKYVEKVKKYADVPIVVLEEALKARPFQPRTTVLEDDPSTIIFSSGTTSKSARSFKAIVLSHKNITSNILSTKHLTERAEKIDSYPQGIYMAGLARQWHSFSYMVQKAFLSSGALLHFTNERGVLRRGHGLEINPHYSIMIPERANLIMRRVKADVRKKGENISKLFNMFIEHSNNFNYNKINNEEFVLKDYLLDQIGKQTLYKIVKKGLSEKVGKDIMYLIGGSAPLPLHIHLFFYSIGIPIYQGYGLTETSPVISVNLPEAYRFGSSGKPIEGVKVLIADSEALERGVVRELGEGERGVILTKGDNVFKEYYGDLELTKSVFVGGWFDTGDLGHKEKGFLFVKGRLKNQIRTTMGESPNVEAEIDYAGKGRISRLILVGDGMKKAGALIIPNEETLNSLEQKLIEEKELKISICNNELGDTVDTLGVPLNPERVAIITDFNKHPTLMTDTEKIRRNLIAETYSEQIQRICNPKSG